MPVIWADCHPVLGLVSQEAELTVVHPSPGTGSVQSLSWNRFMVTDPLTAGMARSGAATRQRVENRMVTERGWFFFWGKSTQRERETEWVRLRVRVLF